MIDVTLADIIIILLLIIECWLLWFWAKEHADLMSIIAHHIVEIKKGIKDAKKD